MPGVKFVAKPKVSKIKGISSIFDLLIEPDLLPRWKVEHDGETVEFDSWGEAMVYASWVARESMKTDLLSPRRQFSWEGRL